MVKMPILINTQKSLFAQSIWLQLVEAYFMLQTIEILFQRYVQQQ